MIVGDHNWRAHAFAHNATMLILHPEVHVEPHLLAMMAAVACYTEWQNHRARGEVERIRTVELDDAEGRLCIPTGWAGLVIGIRASRANTGGNLTCNALGLKMYICLEAGFSDSACMFGHLPHGPDKSSNW